MRTNNLVKMSACGGGALAISLLLFYFMAGLISNKEVLKKPENQRGLVEFTRVKPRSFLDEKKRVLPKKKPKPKKAPRMQKISSALPPTQKMAMNMQLPDIRAALKSSGPAVGGFGGAFGGGAVPLVRVQGVYPPQAAMRGIEGYVLFQFTVTPSGGVSDIKILEAHPPRIFNQSALRALRKWKYKPKIVDGKPVAQKNQYTQMVYSLE